MEVARKKHNNHGKGGATPLSAFLRGEKGGISMENLFSLLRSIPEYISLLEGIQANQQIAVTGLGQVNRSHFIAGLQKHINRPVIVICADDIAAKRTQEELSSFVGYEVSNLPNRDFTFYDSVAVS